MILTNIDENNNVLDLVKNVKIIINKWYRNTCFS